jgi:hypothetical protein
MGRADAADGATTAEVEEEKCIICNGPIELENIKKDSTVKRCKSLP